jgi:beta-phosphoglucomutase
MKSAIIFDMDGVLVDSADAHFRSWQMLAQEEGTAMTRRQFDETFGRPSRDIIRLHFGPDLNDDEVRRMDDRKEALYRDIIRDHIPAMPGARQSIDRMSEAGFLLAVGTSGPPANVELVIKGLGLEDRFAAVITGVDVTRGKPDPQVFQLAAEKLGVPPDRCIVVEDAPAGIDAAQRAGMNAVALDSTHPAAELARADRVLHRLDELTPQLADKLLRSS